MQGNSFVFHQAVPVVVFKAENQVDKVVLVEPHLQDGLRRTAHDVVFPGSLDGFGMCADVIELVAGYELSGQFVGRIAQSRGAFLAQLVRVEDLLTA